VDQGFGSLVGEESELSRVGYLVAWQRRRATVFLPSLLPVFVVIVVFPSTLCCLSWGVGAARHLC
jgi:hypothetical protein